MSRVNGVGGVSVSVGRKGKASVESGGFQVSGDSLAAEGVARAPPAQPAGLAGMLALQEAETETTANRDGRRQGLAVLDALLELQRVVLSTTGDEAAQLARIASLALEPAAVTDPGLADILSAIRLRAKIELLRRGMEFGSQADPAA